MWAVEGGEWSVYPPGKERWLPSDSRVDGPQSHPGRSEKDEVPPCHVQGRDSPRNYRYE